MERELISTLVLLKRWRKTWQREGVERWRGDRGCWGRGYSESPAPVKTGSVGWDGCVDDMESDG